MCIKNKTIVNSSHWKYYSGIQCTDKADRPTHKQTDGQLDTGRQTDRQTDIYKITVRLPITFTHKHIYGDTNQ